MGVVENTHMDAVFRYFPVEPSYYSGTDVYTFYSDIKGRLQKKKKEKRKSPLMPLLKRVQHKSV